MIFLQPMCEFYPDFFDLDHSNQGEQMMYQKGSARFE